MPAEQIPGPEPAEEAVSDGDAMPPPPIGVHHPRILEGFFRGVIAWRWVIIAFYGLLVAPSAWFAMRVHQDNSLDKLIVESDPDSAVSRAFGKAFGQGEYVVLVAEADDPFAPEVLHAFDEIEQRISQLPHLQANSALGIYRRARAGFEPTAEAAAKFKQFVLGTELFRKQGLVSDHHLALALILDVKDNDSRHAMLAAIDDALGGIVWDPRPFKVLRKVGQPYVNAYLDTESRSGALRYMPLFGLFIIAIVLGLYRSWRALWAFLVALGMCAALIMGYIGMTGGVFTIVSALVPMTVLITATATLVYVHSRYVECPPDVAPEDHHVFALANKFLACTASIFAGAVGFAALAVSKIRPVREMGIWVAIGLLLTWIVTFTLFPALQRAFRTPMIGERRIAAGRWFVGFSRSAPLFAWRLRWVLVPGSLLLCLGGVVALFGIPNVLPRMRLEMNALEYINHDSTLYKDTKRLEELGTGMAITEVWLQGDKMGAATDGAVLKGLHEFEESLARDKRVNAVIGLASISEMLRYVGGRGDQFPTDPGEIEALSDQMDQLMEREPMLQRFVDKSLAQTHVSVITGVVDYAGYQAICKLIDERWAEAQKVAPALAQFKLQTTGLAMLQAKISHHLVPTLTESFGLSMVIIYGAFLLIFRNGAARLMAMIPSLFAILVMFLFMRVFGLGLNITTILIASTVLGTTENDQIHFFYHFLERRKTGNVEESLRYTMQVAGRAIIFATAINTGGFLAFALAELPPIREFGILSAVAFTLSMLADFTALPAGLWLVMKERPGELQNFRDGDGGTKNLREDEKRDRRSAAGG